MPLVVFTPEELITGYENDVSKFNADNTASLQFHSSLYPSTATSLETAQTNITTILNELKNAVASAKFQQFESSTVFGSSTDAPSGQHWEDFEYSRDVPKLINNGNSALANMLWGLRHALCYQLLIYTYYKSQEAQESQEAYKEEDLNLFKLGIFGSLTPTSDIDIGVQYSKTTDRKVGIIAHVVKTFEDAFIDLTGKYSLAYDIEPYAGIEFLDDAIGGLFYCDSTDFDESDLLEIMPAIGASIIRNVVQMSIDVNPIQYQDVRRYKEQQSQSGGTAQHITTLIDSFDFNVINTYFTETVGYNDTNNDPLSTITRRLSTIANVEPIKALLSTIANIQLTPQIAAISKMLTNPDWAPYAKILAINYMTNTYDASRKDYYSKVIAAEAMLSQPTFTFDRNNIIEKSVRVALMKVIAEALVFRAESYVSPSTVMHIVRVLQAKEPPPPNNNCEAIVLKKSKAQCALGTYGYMMSCMEQIGYLYRFHQTYCDNTNGHNDTSKCTKKFDKYFPRLVDGLIRLSSIQPISPAQIGGKRRNYSKKLHKLLFPDNSRRQKLKHISKRKNIRSRRRTNKRIRK